MWCFIVIPDMKGRRVEYGGIRLEQGTFAVVECGKVLKQEEDVVKLDIITPLEKEVVTDDAGAILFDDDGGVLRKIFYLADTDAIVAPCCVVPDIGGPVNRYFVIKPRDQWANFFIPWLRLPLDDDMEMSDQETDEDMTDENASGQEGSSSSG